MSTQKAEAKKALEDVQQRHQEILKIEKSLLVKIHLMIATTRIIYGNANTSTRTG